MAVYNLELFNNASYSATFTYKDTDGQPINLTNADVKMQIRETPSSVKAAWTGTEGNGITVTPHQGRVDILIPFSAIKAIPYANGVYDIVLTWPSGKKDILIRGAVAINQGVTK